LSTGEALGGPKSINIMDLNGMVPETVSRGSGKAMNEIRK